MPQETPRGTILVVDDEESIRRMLTDLLEREGYAVVTASGGKAGLEMAREIDPDLIILDIMMEDMDGTEVGSTLREAPRTAGIPIIYLTGLMSAGEAAHRTGKGGDVVIAKPFQAAELLGRIEQHLGSD